MFSFGFAKAFTQIGGYENNRKGFAIKLALLTQG